MRRQKRIHLADEPALQLVLVLEAELLDARLDLRVRFPLILDRLVAADVNPRPRKERHRLVQHVLHERDGAIGRIEEVRRDAPSRAGLDLLVRAAQFGIGGHDFL